MDIKLTKQLLSVGDNSIYLEYNYICNHVCKIGGVEIIPCLSCNKRLYIHIVVQITNNNNIKIHNITVDDDDRTIARIMNKTIEEVNDNDYDEELVSHLTNIITDIKLNYYNNNN